MVYVQRFYINGRLEKTTKPNEIERLRKWLDNIEKDWTKDGFEPLTPVGEFDWNKCHSSNRVSIDELVIVNTAGKSLRWINVERKTK